MSFIKPMLASPMPKNFEPWGYVAEEKFDGHRLCVTVDGHNVQAWSRNELPRILPPHVRDAISYLADGTYDGELISTEKTKSYGVTELVQADKLCFVVFDILRVGHRDVTHLIYSERRQLLAECFASGIAREGIAYPDACVITNSEQVTKLAKQVWARGGEGLILKKFDQPYTPGKRVKHWIKIKQCHTAALKVIGFIAGRLGQHATVLLEDGDGNQTTVKTLNTAEREAFDRDARSYIGRKLRIEYQERTPDGGYRHPMWDRWEEA